jgi:uncharacterized protein YdhG (YjbR/CyaY superfamily)
MTVIDEYLKTVSPAQRQVLKQVRTVIKQAAPDAEEAIGYGIPTFKYKGKNLIHFAAFKNHLSIFPTADPVLSSIDGLENFRTSKGTLQFTIDNPIPDSIIKQIVAIRLKAID